MMMPPQNPQMPMYANQNNQMYSIAKQVVFESLTLEVQIL
jgi:hypothetical protein